MNIQLMISYYPFPDFLKPKSSPESKIPRKFRGLAMKWFLNSSVLFFQVGCYFLNGVLHYRAPSSETFWLLYSVNIFMPQAYLSFFSINHSLIFLLQVLFLTPLTIFFFFLSIKSSTFFRRIFSMQTGFPMIGARQPSEVNY